MGVCTIRVPSALKLTEEPNLAELPVRPVNVVAAPPRAQAHSFAPGRVDAAVGSTARPLRLGFG